MDEQISKTIQQYQSIALLDLLIEFRDELIGRIISRWLRAKKMPNGYTKSGFEDRILNYLETQCAIATITIEFKSWRKRIEPTGNDQDDPEFAKLIQSLGLHLNELALEFDKFMVLFPVGGECGELNGETNIDRLREDQCAHTVKAEARRVGLAIDAFVSSKIFQHHLLSTETQVGLVAIFNIVLLSVNNSVAVEIKPIDVADQCPRHSGGTVNFLLPPHDLLFFGPASPELLMDQRYKFQTFFPLTSPSEARRLENALIQFQNNCEIILDQHLIPDSEPTAAIFRGGTTFVYDSSYAKSIVKDKEGHLLPGEVWLLSRNVNFIQFLPNSSSKILGFFQLQSPLPGLIEAIFPVGECSEEWRRLSEDSGSITARTGTLIFGEKTVLAELPRDYKPWYEKNLTESPMNPPLEVIHWIRESSADWAMRFYNQMILLDNLRIKLWKEIEPRINRSYRLQLDQLNFPLDSLLAAVTELQKSSNQIRSIIKEPSDVLFGAHAAVAWLFDENTGEVSLASDLRAKPKHEPTAYDSSKPEEVKCLRAVIALLLLQWTGHEKDTAQWSYKELISKTIDWLDRCEHDSSKLSIIKWIRKVFFRSDFSFQATSRLSDLLHPSLSLDAIKAGALAAKAVLFTPFKLASAELPVIAVAIATGVEKITLTLNQAVEAAIGSSELLVAKLDLKETISPSFPREILQFLIGVVGEAENRLSPVKIEAVRVTIQRKLQLIELTFAQNYLSGAVSELSVIIQKLLTAIENRDWRIEPGASGNFTAPYMRLTSRLNAYGTDWKKQPATQNEILKLIHRDRTFKIEVQAQKIAISWTKP